MIVLDTNVLSEAMRVKPEPRVLAWLNANEGMLWTSATTIQEIVYGIRRVKNEPHRERLRRNFEAAAAELIGERIFNFDETAARTAGQLVALREHSGKPIGIADAQIAAISLRNATPLATRDTGDFADLGLSLINPWET